MYEQVFIKIKEKYLNSEKINIIFLVNENAKWKCQSVYDKFNADSRFDAKIVLTIADFDVYCDKSHRTKKMLENESFFSKRDIVTLNGWNTEEDIALDIKQFSPDIIFYQVPYNIASNQNIDYASQFALCMYIPYYVNQSEEFSFMGTEEWHRKLFRFYVLNEYWKAVTAKKLYSQGENLCPAGHPIFDNYNSEVSLRKTDKSKGYIIYAAHWSVGLADGLSSFLETGYFMLSYAKKHPELPWCFTCHPTLFFNLVDKGFMTQQEVEDYVSEWKQIAYCPGTDGNYMELFQDSRMLISDCGSFRLEYYPTGKPYIYLISNTAKRLKDGFFLSEISKNYHHVHNCAELKVALDGILLQNNDCFKEARLKDRENCDFLNQSSAEKIHSDIIKICNGKHTMCKPTVSLLEKQEHEKSLIQNYKDTIDFLSQRLNKMTLRG